MTTQLKTREFRIPPAHDPRKQPWWWEHDYDERQLRLETRKMVMEAKRDRKIPVPRHVYFLGADGTDLVKIGSAFDIELRLEQLRTISPVPLRLLFYVLHGGEAMERRLHRMYRRRRSHGEWFRVDVDELRAAADGLIAEARAARESRVQ